MVAIDITHLGQVNSTIPWESIPRVCYTHCTYYCHWGRVDEMRGVQLQKRANQLYSPRASQITYHSR